MIRVLFHLVDYDSREEGLEPLPVYLPLIMMLWDDVVRNYHLDGLIVIDQTEARLAADLTFADYEFDRFESLAEAEAAFGDAQWVYFEHGGQPLSDFEHPAGDAVYAFGPDTVGLPLEPGRTHVEIPTLGRIGFMSPVAASIAFHDRLTRLGD